jgi:hypothetical protein
VGFVQMLARGAELGHRIELREQRAQDLEDDARFDLAWFPTVFVSEAAVRPACERIKSTLRPGGWLLFIALNPNADALGTAVWRLRMTMYGNAAVPTSSVAPRSPDARSLKCAPPRPTTRRRPAAHRHRASERSLAGEEEEEEEEEERALRPTVIS